MNDELKVKSEAWQSIKGNEHLKRALEIALIGDHTITVIGKRGNGDQYLPVVYDRITFIEHCACGNYKDPNQECYCTLARIRRYQTSKRYLKAMQSDMIIEIQRPRFQDLHTDSEPFTDVLKRVKVARTKNFGSNGKLSKECLSLLESAYQRLGLTAERYNIVIKVASTIAHAEDTEDIKPQHIAEAIQYQSIG